jgi:hypothetical protein
MANNQKKLKAFVRYDGSGRVVASSLILRKNKPRVGRWFEIPEYLCCNGAPSSTTTTTTNGGGGVTPTAFIKSYFLNTFNACNSTTDGSLLFYSASTTIQAGITVFTDASLTTPVTAGLVIVNSPQPMQNVLYLVGEGGVLSVFYCPYILGISYSSASNACGYNETYPFYTANNVQPSNGVTLYYDQALTITANNIPYLSYNASLFSTDQNGVMLYTGPC